MSHALFDAIAAHKKLRNDQQVGDLLGTKRNSICQYRNGQLQIGPAIILKVYDATGWSIERIRELAADTTTPRAPRIRPPKPVAKPWPAVASRNVKPAAPVVVAPAVHVAQSNVTITKTPKWVSRVHRIV